MTNEEADLEAAEFWPRLSALLMKKPNADQIDDLVDEFMPYKEQIEAHIDNDEDLADLSGRWREPISGADDAGCEAVRHLMNCVLKRSTATRTPTGGRMPCILVSQPP